MFDPELSQQLRQHAVLAVLILRNEEDAVPVARALLKGGVQAMELTLRTESALSSIQRISSELPEMIVGAGTVLTRAQLEAAQQAGARFAVAPGMNPKTIAAAQELQLSFAPGVVTPTDIELALEAGCQLMKFFPAEPSGGLPYLKAIAAPFAHLGVSFIPLGGITTANAATYLSEPSVHALGGSWLAPADLIHENRWDLIEQRAREITTLISEHRAKKAITP